MDKAASCARAGPVRRPGNSANHEFRGVERNRPLEGVATLERSGLLAGPRADLRKPRPGGEIGIRLGIIDSHARATQSNLPVQRFPMEQQRALMGGVQLPSLLTVDIRV